MAIVEDDGTVGQAAGANLGGGSRVGIVTHPISGFTPSPNPLDTVQQMQEQMAAMKAQIEALTKKQPTASASRSGASRRRRKAAAQGTQMTHQTQRPSAKDRLGQPIIVTDASGRVIPPRHQTPSPRRRSEFVRTEHTARSGGHSSASSQSTTGRSGSQAAHRSDALPYDNREKAPVEYDADGREIIRSRSGGRNDRHIDRNRALSKGDHHDRSPRRNQGHGHHDNPEYDMGDTGDFIVVRDPCTGESK